MAKVKKSSKQNSNILALAFTFAIIALVFFGYSIMNVTSKNTDTESKVQGANTNGFNSLGYNYSARIFNGLADGVDKNLDGTVWGSPTYANDKLVMKWNEEWDRGNLENWSKPPYGAWEDNEWNGKLKGGSGQTWHYKIVWHGSCGADLTPLPDGGYCLWGQFEVLMDQGQDPNLGPGHTWFAHANPTGYGAFKH